MTRWCLCVLLTSGAIAGCDDKPVAKHEPVSAAADSSVARADPSPATKPSEPEVAKPTTAIEPAPEMPSLPNPSINEGITQSTLDRFIPAEVRGVKKYETAAGLDVTEGSLIAHGSYLLDDGKKPRFVNINLAEVVDLEFEKAQFVVGDGESKETATSSVAAKLVDGRLVQRRFSKTQGSSEVIVLLGDRITARVSVEQAKNPDEAYSFLTALDLAGIVALTE